MFLLLEKHFYILTYQSLCVSFHINNPNIGDFIGLSMKFILSLIICSQIQSVCMPPYEWPETFNNQYDCMTFGYQESLMKMQEIGPEEVNKHNIYIRFLCTPSNSI